MDYSIETINLSRLYLHNDNPRHDPISSESEIISYLIANEGVKKLARHIAEAGSISPLERIGVVAHPKAGGAYVAVEGNRRVCAIKLLADPDKADTESNRKYFRNLQSKMTRLPSSVEAVVFPNFEMARPWISLRHEGEQDGAGTKRWTSEQQARFNAQEGNGKNANIQAYLLMQYVRNRGLLPIEQVEALSITTLTRYLSNPTFRRMLGLVDNKTLDITVPPQEFERAATRFLLDSLNTESGVSSRTSATDRKRYAEKLQAEGFAPITRGVPTVKIEALPLTSSPSATSSKTVIRRNNPSPDNRKTVIPGNFSARITNPILKRLYDELRTLEAERHSFAAAYLLRAVIEQMTTLVLRKNGKPEDRPLHLRLGRLADLLQEKGMTENTLKKLHVMANNVHDISSPDTMGSFVHGGIIPTRVELIKTWDSLEPVIRRVFDELN